MCELAASDHGPDAYLNTITGHIRRIGWAIQGVPGARQRPAWAYSVGIWHTFRGPEFSVFGLSLYTMAAIINVLGRRIADGAAIAPGDRLDDVSRCPFMIRPVHESWRATSLFAVSDTIYGYLRPSYLQIVWPDLTGRWPWERGFDARFGDLQPLLWLPRDDHPPGTWTRVDSRAG
jgi:Domain of unknown function (DUF4262)